MFTRSLDEIIHATATLPDHLVVARRCYGGNADAMRALRRLQDALMEVEGALLGRRASAPTLPDGTG